MNTYVLRAGRTLLLVILFVNIACSIMAQGYIDEDFLEKLSANAAPMLKENDAAFNVVNTPSNWNNESAVIIGFSRSVLFDRKSSGGFFSRRERSLYFFEKTRFRIRLNDKNSVNSFSEIYFRYGAKEDGFIARIIKPGDTAVVIDLKNAVAVEKGSEIPEFFQSFFDKVAYSSYQYYKVPIANLEPGDILEYVTTTKSRLDVTTSGYVEFTPVFEVCNKTYPVMHNEIIIETDDKSFFKSLSLNGAPIFKKENSTESGFFRFVFTDKNRDTEKDINFVSPFLQFPFVKFQVIYSNNDQVKGALIGEKGELKSSFSREELCRKAWEDYELVSDIPFRSMMTVQFFINQCWTELTKLGAKNMSEQQYINTVYYYLRNRVVFMDEYLSDKKFAYIFGSLLFQRDIKSDILISTGNNTGRLKEVLFDDEIRYVIKVGDKLYFNVTDYSNPGDLSETLLDNDAYIIYAPDKKTKKQDIKEFTLPGTRAEDNTSSYTITAELNADMKNLSVSRTSSFTGIQKARSSEHVLKYIPYMFDDYKNYGGEEPSNRMKAKEADDYQNSLRTVKDEFKKQKPEYVKESLESEFSRKVNNANFNLVSDGRSQKKSVLTYQEEFVLPDFVRKAGKKYLINLPALMGSQLQIKSEERNRKYDIDVRYPKTYNWNIQFKIPQNYTVSGLTEMNQSVDNETGNFKLTAKEENGNIVINIIKTYKQKSVLKAKWNDMLAFIDAAYAGTFKYVLLTPK